MTGWILLKIARLVFDEQSFEAVVQPTIADMQREIADAGTIATRRLCARWRGYRAFWTLMLIAPFASISAVAPADSSSDAARRHASIFAAVLPIPVEPLRRSPQINFSSTEVAGNIGGLIFVVGSVFVIVVGLPSVIWFLFAAAAAGSFLAWALLGWRRGHPGGGLPENRIVLR